MSDLAKRLLKASGNNLADLYENSKIINSKEEFVDTGMIMLNTALSGRPDGGLVSGITSIAGPSRHFKTLLGIMLMKSFQDKYDEGVVVYLDSEVGGAKQYFESFNIDTSRVVHVPICDIEEACHQTMSILKEATEKDKIFIFFDSIGNTASKKERTDAEEGKSVADMSRAKALKSFFRIITPKINLNKYYFVGIHHTYKTQELFPKDVVSGGCVVAGTKIKTNSGLKNIEDILIGDYVVTTMGNKEVTHVWNPETLLDGTPECFEIEFEDGFVVRCSDKHKFLVNGEWKEAQDLVIHDDVESLKE